MADPNLRTQHPPDKPTLDAWLAALAAAGCEPKRSGANWAGPCPLCGGEDRFHLQGDPPHLVGCRGCMDGPGDRKRYGELMRLLFPREGRQRPSKRRTPAPKQSPSPAADRPRQAASTAFANEIWESAGREERSKAAIAAFCAYFEKRLCWPTFEGAPRLPACVRWLAAGGRVAMPPEAVGCLVWGFRTPQGQPAAVQLEALSAAGKRLDAWPHADGAKRKTFGPIGTAWMQVGTPSKTLILCEGPTDALASWWLHPGAAVWCCGGTLRLKRDDLAGVVETVRIEADADATSKADSLGIALQADGLRVSVMERQRGDVADALAERIREAFEERAAIREYDGEMPRPEAEAEAAIRDAWRPYITSRKEPE